MKHTPGPWLTQNTAGHDIHGQAAVYSESSGKDLAIVYDGDANARLISAAPMMFSYIEKKSMEGDKEATRILAEINA